MTRSGRGLKAVALDMDGSVATREDRFHRSSPARPANGDRNERVPIFYLTASLAKRDDRSAHSIRICPPGRETPLLFRKSENRKGECRRGQFVPCKAQAGDPRQSGK